MNVQHNTKMLDDSSHILCLDDVLHLIGGDTGDNSVVQHTVLGSSLMGPCPTLVEKGTIPSSTISTSILPHFACFTFTS
jgi:hypothetical protein